MSTMSEQEIKDLTRRMWDEYNAVKGDLARLNAWVDRFYSPTVLFHAPISGDMNFEQFKQFEAAALAISTRFTVKHVIAEGDIVVSQFTMNMNHQGPFMGLPATGKSFQVEGSMIAKMAGGRCEEI